MTISTQDKARIDEGELRLMQKQGWSPAELAIHFDCPVPQVERALRRLGLEGLKRRIESLKAR
ncbi:MAG: hypothetical protein WC370_01870 [Dehalococcoidales bacterium]